MKHALVIGGGPAGLMAAEQLARSGLRTTVAEAKPSVARKFLMAGKSGLNITKAEPLDDFCRSYPDLSATLRRAIRDFGPENVEDWARELGQEVFTGSSDRVFPTAMKASPLLRAWLSRLAELGVDIRPRWRWTDGLSEFHFDTPHGSETIVPDVAVFALGGASWARLGADGRWAETLRTSGVSLAPFKPANMGFQVDWSEHMSRHFGSPVKGVILKAGETRHRGEFVISSKGIEGSGIYAISRAAREGAELTIDLMPDWSVQKILKHLSRPRGKMSQSNFMRKALKLPPVKQALLMEFAHPLPKAEALAPLIKSLPIRHAGPRPIDEAISTAGGVRFDALDDGLMLKTHPGVFCCGEMLDWEAPTGGYLITACLATGRHAGLAAVEWGESAG